MTSEPSISTRTPKNVASGDKPSTKTGLLKRLAGVFALTAMFGSVFLAATSAPSAADWREECIGEGCSGGEKAELFEGFQEECVDEGCWAEEVGELAGSGLNTSGGFIEESVVTAMMNDFQARSTYDALAIEVRPGKTYTPWNDIWQEIRWIIETVS